LEHENQTKEAGLEMDLARKIDPDAGAR